MATVTLPTPAPVAAAPAATFRDFLRQREAAPRTVATYTGTVRRVDGTDAPDPAAVVAWLRVAVTAHTPRGTFLAYRACVNQYLAWTGYALPDPPLLPKVRRLPARFRDALDEAEYAAWVTLVAEADVPIQTRMILALLPVTALRISEACALRWEFYKPGEAGRAKITIVGKGQKQAVLALGSDASAVLAALHDASGHPARGWVFESPVKPGHPLTPGAVRHHVRRLSEGSSIGKSVSPHILRHTTATRLLRSGAPLPVVQAILRHTDIKTTTLYLHPTDADIASALDRL
jgi:integrase/recombinase XerC